MYSEKIPSSNDYNDPNHILLCTTDIPKSIVVYFRGNISGNKEKEIIGVIRKALEDKGLETYYEKITEGEPRYKLDGIAIFGEWSSDLMRKTVADLLRAMDPKEIWDDMKTATSPKSSIKIDETVDQARLLAIRTKSKDIKSAIRPVLEKSAMHQQCR